MKRILSILALLFCMQLEAQVVNTEKKRLRNPNQGLNGSLDLGLALIRNTNDILQFNTRINLNYLRKKHLIMLLGDFGFFRANKSALENRGFGHLRYNYELDRRFILEAFSQNQYNQIQKIGDRSLWGAGPRMRILENDSARFFVGALYMYEYEEVSDSLESRNRDHRMSAYLSAGYTVKKLFSIDNITYFQPMLRDFADFRIASETNFLFHLTTRLSLKISFVLNHDTRPPEEIENTFYRLTNGLKFKF